MNYVLGYDLGTSYFKAAVVDESGAICGIGRGRTPKQEDGTVVTMTAEAFREGVRTCTAEALSKAGITGSDICGISYASQANTFLLLDRENRPVTDLFVWTTQFSRETEPELETVWKENGLIEQTGLGYVDAGLLVSKLLWLRRNRPDLWERAARVMTISDYLMFSLTETFAADASTSALLGYLDVRRGDWLYEGLHRLNLPAEFFPAVYPVGAYVGRTTAAAAEFAGLPAGIALYAGGLDHAVAAYGAGLGTAAEMSESTGTVLACLALRPDAETRPHVLIGPTAEPGVYSHLSFSGAGAEVIEELHEQRFPYRTIDEMLAEGEKSPPGAAGLRYQDSLRSKPLDERFSAAEGKEVREYADEDFVRAVEEAISYHLYALARSVAGDSDLQRIVATGGANRSSDLLQVKADMFGVEVLYCGQPELGAFGAALLAAVGCSWFPSVAAAQEQWVQIQFTAVPDPDRHRMYQKLMHEEYFT